MLFQLDSQQQSEKTPDGRKLLCLAKIQSKLTECFGKFYPDCWYPYVSGADWSTHDIICYAIEQFGPCDLTAATWSLANHAIEKLCSLKTKGNIKNINFLCDWRVQVRSPEAISMAKTQCDKIRVSTCHAKVFVLENEKWTMSCAGSANFTNNPRIEAGTISTVESVGKFHKKWIMDEINNAAPFGLDMRKVGKKDGRQ